MASLELRNSTYRVVFMFRGKKYSYSLDTGDRQDAEALRGGAEKLLWQMEQNLLQLPDRTDVVTFLKNGGRPREEAAPAPEPLTLARFGEKYLETHGQGAMEPNSLVTARIHLDHFGRTLGKTFDLGRLTLADLQRHVTERAKKKYRGRPLSPATLRKEISTLRAAWNWASLNGLVKGPFPNRGLVFPKADEKPPFMTWAEIERRIASGGLSDAEKADLWDCLYLTPPELMQLLEHVRTHAAFGWLYPLLCFVAHTGARRSEAIRVQVHDVDFDAMTVLVREKKRSREQRTTRRVPLTPFLAQVLKNWLKEHPGGPALFCHSGEVFRSKKRSRTTGHQNERVRPSSLKGRLATVRNREQPAACALTPNEVHDHFRRTLDGSKWEVLPGLHCLRHSFISACASKGVDQRLIDEWTGHSTEEQRKRYRHLYPTTQQEAIRTVFG